MYSLSALEQGVVQFLSVVERESQLHIIHVDRREGPIIARVVSTPVALFLFNRPDTTQRVFDRIALARPRQLLIVGDGPRLNRDGEPKLCAAARRAVVQVNWPCEVLTRYSDVNLGCRRSMSEGLDWVFSLVDRAVILEDDCLPEPSFFPFCDAMLEWFAEDPRVMMVTGFNAAGKWRAKNQDYHFSYCGSIWGWASWRRAWQHYDVDMKQWADAAYRERIQSVLGEPELYESRMKAYDSVYRREVDTWDYQWSTARLNQGALSVVPAINLISNLGFRADATHTRKENNAASSVPTGAISFPLRQPSAVVVDRAYDRAFTRIFAGRHADDGKPIKIIAQKKAC